MKTLQLSIITILVLGISFLTGFHAYADNQDPGMNILSHESPLKQFKSGIPLQKIQCRTDLVLVIKAHEGTPACVRQSSIAKLVYRGWASLISTPPEPTLRILGPYDGLQNPTGIVTIQNKTFFMTTFNGTLNPYSGYQEVAFYGINFTLFPQPQSLEISGKEFYADVGFSGNIHEQLWLEAPAFADMGNITITRLTQHTNPQAGIVSYNEQIKLLVSTDVNTTSVQTQTFDSSSTLKLYLTTTSQVIRPGQEIGISISVNNTLSTPLDISSQNNWSYENVSAGPCSKIGYGIAILEGFYTVENLTKGKNLFLYSFDVSCPFIRETASVYEFQPKSDKVSEIQCKQIQGISCYQGQYEMGGNFGFNGYWEGGNHFKPFNPGLYTIVGAEEWGHVAIEHFVVSNSTIFAGELGSANCPAMYSGVQFGAAIKNSTGFAHYYDSDQYGNTFFLHPGTQGTINVQYSVPANAAWFQNNGNTPFNMTNGAVLLYMANVTKSKTTISYAVSLSNDETGHHSQICHYGMPFGGFAEPCNFDNTGDIPLGELPDASRLLHVGLNTSFEPNSVMFYPNSNPVFTATVSANSDAMPGTYWLSLGRGPCGPGVLTKLFVVP